LLLIREILKFLSRRGGKGMKRLNGVGYIVFALVLSAAIIFTSASVSFGKTAKEIDVSADVTMDLFKKKVKGATEYLKAAKGVLVIPNITKAAFIVGGQYGQGALRIGGKTEGYYSLAAGSVGYQIGGEQYDMVILFMTDEALNKFRKSKGWEAGVDGEVTLIKVGADVTVETLRSQSPIAGFVFDQKGLMAGVSIRGAKFTKISPD
jgi:lipid-binding SYLF domain-containing protein